MISDQNEQLNDHRITSQPFPEHRYLMENLTSADLPTVPVFSNWKVKVGRN